ncbi:TetR/AcrR family transcriptional regulator [Brevibacterium sp. S111]|uniref:TetR/AcrR family transcriptional regulator n=1 Tax=unclassified Brevibacterium TaxID=2614124 RepID=UPI0010820289|nr:TetR/AcrR family transcriptional regulator [Brevibacterium sp. S111]TGD13583.1 TetR/AcrR family transcriptional regulator [Brevibacterium sp. S111]
MELSARGSYAVGRRRRDRIVDVATAKFTEGGYSRTSLAEIAREVGLTTPGLTHHFPTKQHLLLAVADRRLNIATALVESSPPDVDGLGPLRLMLRISKRLAEEPALAELFVLVSAEAADPNGPAHPLFVEHYTKVVEELAGLLRAGADNGFLRTDIDYVDVARECIAVADGVQLQWVITRGEVDLVGIIRRHLERVGESITVSAEPVCLEEQ